MTARHEAAPPADRWRIPSPSECRKAIVGLAAGASQLVALGVLHGTAQHVVQVVAAVAGVVLTFAVPNARPPLEAASRPRPMP